MPDVLRLHRQSLEEFGGAEGIREPGLIESALVSAQNEHYYRQGDLFSIAAAYAFHIAEAQAFLDGNKRTAISSAITFLHLNGVRTFPTDSDLYVAMISIARHTLDKPGLAGLFRAAAAPEDATLEEPTAEYAAARPFLDTRLPRGRHDVDFSGIVVEGNTPGIHPIRAMRPGFVGAEAAFIWIVREADANLIPGDTQASLKVHLGVYSSSGLILGWLVFQLENPETSVGQVLDFIVDCTERRVIDALVDLDRQSHWHIDVRTTSGNRVARFEFENVFGIHRILTLLKSAPTDYSHEDFLKVLAEFEANYSIPDLLAA